MNTPIKQSLRDRIGLWLFDKLEGWGIGMCVCLTILGASIILGRCTHEPENRTGFVVKKINSDYGKESHYELLEPGLLGTRITIVDSAGKYQIGDTLIFSRKK